MTTRVDDVLRAVAADVAEHGFDDELLSRSLALIQMIAIETEEDRRLVLLGYLRILDIVLPYSPQEMAEALEEQRQQMQATFDYRYERADSPYLATMRITTELVEALEQGGPAEGLLEKATAELAALPYDQNEDDQLLMLVGGIRISSVQTAHNWFQQVAKGKVPNTAITPVVRQLGEALRRDGFDSNRILEAARFINGLKAEDQESKGLIASGLMHVYGMGLLLRPDATPALEPVEMMIVERVAQVAEEEGQAAAAAPEPEPTRYDPILDEYRATLERNGFSHYAFQQTQAAIQEMQQSPAESEEDPLVITDVMLRMIDLSVTYASAQDAPMLAVMRSTLEQVRDPDALDELTPAEIRAQAEAISRELKQNFLSGELPGQAAVLQAMMKFKVLAERSAQADEETGKFVLGKMQQIFSMLEPYIPEGTENAFAEYKEFLDSTLGLATSGDLEKLDDAASAAVFEEQIDEESGRLLRVVVAQDEPKIASHPTASIPHVRQFLELFPDLVTRMGAVRTQLGEVGEDDEAEMERVNKRLEKTLQAIRFAYSEEQLVRHQREGLRGAVLELRQFERRHHLTLVHPVFPTNSLMLNPNDVFFSGTDGVAKLVKRACDAIGMKPAAKQGIQNKTHGRWQQLRGSGIAIFDYSAYDPVLADPSGPVKRSRKGEDKVLDAAGPLATVAYENGWAYVLGTPKVIVARKGQAVPFDVDIEPVWLEGDDGDVERLIIGMQTVLYGLQHGVDGDCLAETLAEARRLYGEDDPEVRKLLAALTDVNDATRVRLVLNAVINRIEGENPMLVFPVSPGSYPGEGRPELFHISGFRGWSKALQEEARMACERTGVDYRIGYKRLNPDIVRIIWADICRASFVVADITNLNPNAVLELAMAQAVGRPTLILTRNLQPHAYLPAIQKVRTHYYDPDNARENLASLLDTFLAGKG